MGSQEHKIERRLVAIFAAKRETLKAEVGDLRGGTRELTRANREYVAQYETLRAETAKVSEPWGQRCPDRSMEKMETLLKAEHVQ